MKEGEMKEGPGKNPSPLGEYEKIQLIEFDWEFD